MAISTALNRLEREIGVKRCIILDGNVRDIYLDKNRRQVSLIQYLNNLLKSNDYSVVEWDIATGISGDVNILTLDDITTPEGDIYELDDSQSLDMETGVNPSAVQTIKDMFNLIRINMTKESGRKIAFVISFADYVFGSNNQLDLAERESLTMISKALKDKPLSTSLTPAENVVIFITDNIAKIPSCFYIKNPDVSCITISRPDRQERRELFDKIRHCFEVKEEKNSIKLGAQIDMLEGFTNREIIQMGMMSKGQHTMSRGQQMMSFEKLFFLFKYGEKENPWEKLDYNAICNIKQELGSRVIGQDEAIDKIEKVVIKAYMGLTGIHKSSSRNAPKGVLFFVGPTGVGKTELSKALAKFLFGDENACIRFDMSEYSQETSDQKLIGAPPGYVGYEEGGQLTNAVREKPFSIILFDEIEKAAKGNPRILDIFLQILEDGRLTDNKGETVYFSESVIVFTSNLGSSEISSEGTNREIAERFIDTVKNYFNIEIGRPELLGRIGYSNIVPFNYIKDTSLCKRIASSKLVPIRNAIKEKYGFDLIFDDEEQFVNYIIGGADSNKGGRDILNAINDRLLDDLAVFLFSNNDSLEDLKGSEVRVSLEDNHVKFIFA